MGTSSAGQSQDWSHLLSGAGAGFLTTVLLHPLDLIKTRMHVQEAGGRRLPYYSNVLQAFRVIVRVEGARGLYQGVGPNIFGSTVSWALYMFGYNQLKADLTRMQEARPADARLSPSAVYIVAATASGTAVSLVMHPVFTIKTRMQPADRCGSEACWSWRSRSHVPHRSHALEIALATLASPRCSAYTARCCIPTSLPIAVFLQVYRSMLYSYREYTARCCIPTVFLQPDDGSDPPGSCSSPRGARGRAGCSRRRSGTTTPPPSSPSAGSSPRSVASLLRTLFRTLLGPSSDPPRTLLRRRASPRSTAGSARPCCSSLQTRCGAHTRPCRGDTSSSRTRCSCSSRAPAGEMRDLRHPCSPSRAPRLSRVGSPQVSHGSVQFLSYEHLKQAFRGLNAGRAPAGAAEADLSAPQLTAAATGSKVVATLVTYPYQVCPALLSRLPRSTPASRDRTRLSEITTETLFAHCSHTGGPLLPTYLPTYYLLFAHRWSAPNTYLPTYLLFAHRWSAPSCSSAPSSGATWCSTRQPRAPCATSGRASG